MPEDNKEKELLDRIADLELQIKKLKDRKRYGLVWEDKIEKFDKDSKNALPILREKGGGYPDIVNDKNKDFNILIEGDNYHSLSVLSYTHKNKVDVIYIDPPYNTGNKDFRYNDYYVDKEDRFRHSKWLSFLDKRLRLAKSLLKKEGVIFISIDDNEQAQLKLLCNEIFGKDNFIGHITVQGSANESNEGVMFQNVTEYLFCYAKNKLLAKINKIDAVNENWRSLNDAPSGLSTRKQMGYTIYYNTTTQDIIPKIDYDIRGDFSDLENIYKDDKELLHRGYIAIRPKTRNGVAWRWRWGIETLIDRKNELRFRQNRNGDWVVEFGQSGFNAPRDYQEFGTGTTELKRIFCGDGVFNKPKSTEFVKWILKVGANKSAIILDFFAGSGTTGHAVLEMNKQDIGKRKFILCTNNENKICENITYERIKRVSSGYNDSENSKVEGLGGNLKYLKTDFVELEKSADSLKYKIVEGSTEIICLKEDSFNLVSDSYTKNKIKIFQNQNRYTAILFDLFYFDDFIEQLKKLKDKPVSVYVFSYTKDFSKEEFGDLGIKFTIEPIPEKILETYKKIFNF